jgi:hypothetical protein
MHVPRRGCTAQGQGANGGKSPSHKKKRPEGRMFCRVEKCVVRLAGFEPTTPWFVAKYSIQLSYSRPNPKL